MSVFRFEDPPPARGGRRPTRSEEAGKLMERPGTWGLIGTYKSRTSAASMATCIRTGRTSTWRPAGHFDAVSRSVDGEYRVYAVYKGDGALPDE